MKTPGLPQMNSNNRVYFLAINYQHFGKTRSKAQLFILGRQNGFHPLLRVRSCAAHQREVGRISSWVANIVGSQLGQRVREDKQVHKHV